MAALKLLLSSPALEVNQVAVRLFGLDVCASQLCLGRDLGISTNTSINADALQAMPILQSPAEHHASWQASSEKAYPRDATNEVFCAAAPG